MNIDWEALLIVTVVSIVATVGFMTLVSLGIRFVNGVKPSVRRDGAAEIPGLVTLGYVCIGAAGVLVLFGLYLIIPQFH